MRIFLCIIISSLLFACKDPTATGVWIINNPTYHTIELTFYNHLDLPTVINVDQINANKRLLTSGMGNPELIENSYDSVLIVYDDTVKITQYSFFGKQPLLEGNEILDFTNWNSVASTEESKKDYIVELIYTFTEQDYLDAL